MKGIFEVKTIEADWNPPFKKNINTEEYEVGENEVFDHIKGNGNDESVFKLLRIIGDRAVLRYSRLFSLKGSTEGAGAEKTVELTRGTEQGFSYLWGEKGITKKVIYKGVAINRPTADEEPEPNDEEPEPEEPEEEENTEEDSEEEESEEEDSEEDGEEEEDSEEDGEEGDEEESETPKEQIGNSDVKNWNPYSQ